jgi:Ca2+-binding EF-hand superfamily protein
VDAAYLGGVLNIFGKFDTDRNGFIELREFGALWKHLQGPVLAAGEPSALATPRAAGAGQAAAAAVAVRAPAALAPPAPGAETSALAALLARGAHTVSMSEAFQACDVDGDGVLNEVEVSELVSALGYDVDAAYLGGVLNIFGKFDTDRNGFIELREFGALWEHLQGPVLAAGEPSALANSRVTMPVELDAVATPAVQSSTTTEVVSQNVGAWGEDRRGCDIPEGVPPRSSLQRSDSTHATPSSSFFNDFNHPSEIAEQRELSSLSSAQPHPDGGVGSTLFADTPQQASDNDDGKPAGRCTNSISFGRDTVQLYLATFPPYRCCENIGLADIRLLHL